MTDMAKALKAISTSENRTSRWEFHYGIGACAHRQTSGSGCTAIPATVADCLRSQLTTDAYLAGSLASVFIRQQSEENKAESVKRDVTGQLKMLLCHPQWLIPAGMLAAGTITASHPFSFMLLTSGRSSVLSSCAHGVHVAWLETLVICSKCSKLNTFKVKFHHRKKNIQKVRFNLK